MLDVQAHYHLWLVGFYCVKLNLQKHVVRILLLQKLLSLYIVDQDLTVLFPDVQRRDLHLVP